MKSFFKLIFDPQPPECFHMDWREIERFYDEERSVTTVRFVCNTCNQQWDAKYCGDSITWKEEKEKE